MVTDYFGDYSTVTPAVADPTDTYTNVFGQTSKVVEHNGTSTFTTQYGYDAKGNLETITDPRGNITTYGYDWVGQRTVTADPDAGKSTTEYDANGRISRVSSDFYKATNATVWPRTVLTYGYDNLGRKISVTSGSDTLASWKWDELYVTGGKGQITSATSRDTEGRTYTTRTGGFDDRGRPLSTTITIPTEVIGLAGDYTTSYGYDAADHLTSVTYPKAGGLDAETVTAGYDDYGRPRTLISPLQTYVRATDYDAYGRLTSRSYGPDLTSNTAAKAQRTYGYYDDNGTRRLQSISTTTASGPAVTPTTLERQQDTYTYDFDGKLTQLREQATGQTAQSQCFLYDRQGRLTGAHTRSTGTACALGVSDFTGTDPYETDYTYDRLGNLQSVTDTTQAGTATTRDYLYPGYDDAGTWTTANAAQPHGVRKINTITAGTTTATEDLTYDNAGQMDTRVAPGKSTDYDWTKLGQLATVKTTTSDGSKLTRYAYDADGNLVVRTTPQETVASIGGMELRTTDNKTVTATRYYTSGGATVAMRTTEGTTAAGSKLTYLMADDQASTQLAVDATTGATTHRRYTPFGDERGGTLPTGTDNGFLGKTEDTSTGLSLLGARAYDPNLGRFLSTDPLSSPYMPQRLSAYSYSENDPINRMDPTGLESCYPNFCSGDNGTYDEYDPKDDPGSSVNNIVTDISGGEAPPLDEDLVEDYDGRPTESQMRRLGTYMEGVSLELNYELYFREYCNVNPSIDLTCKNLREYYGGWEHVKSIESVDTCPICGNVGFQFIMDYVLGRLGGPCSRNSFLPEANVLMADGTAKEIQDVQVGDKILATNPENGETEARTVLATIITEDDKDFTEVAVRTSDGVAEVIATNHHPFWSPSEHAWVDAVDLEKGMTLRTETGAVVTVGATHSLHRKQETRNLTVDGLHTYYVRAGDTSVLVHNAGGPSGCGLWTSARNRTGVQNAYSHWNKHKGDFPNIRNSREYVDQAYDFMTSPNSAIQEKVRSNGDFVRFNANTNEFGVMTSAGVMRTYYKPDPAVHGYPTNQDYFNAQ
ncbi:polymorphic toxin-type HINT domain-containing protein [Streptomyces aquilus]|uniref:polymorphic toxin-type HINT domain-containing protein n=1 Tax=Streptomyces aquilus TaxID=2548456 RepID=UPI001416F15B|nr:polymorphic toxin-type HINT domain-containing protein [Streptomyces aquilus]